MTWYLYFHNVQQYLQNLNLTKWRQSPKPFTTSTPVCFENFTLLFLASLIGREGFKNENLQIYLTSISKKYFIAVLIKRFHRDILYI